MLDKIFGAIIESNTRNGISMPNVPTPTMGGNVWWNTLAECDGWRLQQNMVSQHARILDPNNVRRAWGDVSTMEKKFEQITSARRNY